MPKSKTRKTGHPARQPTRPTGRPVLSDPDKGLEVAVLSVLEATLAVVQEAETRLIRDLRNGDDTSKIAAIHLSLRAAGAGLISAHTKLVGLPDPTEGTA